MKKTYIAPATEMVVLNTLDVIAASSIIADIVDDLGNDIF
jgi:hypothetical protein